MGILFFSEFLTYLEVKTASEMTIEPSKGGEKVRFGIMYFSL